MTIAVDIAFLHRSLAMVCFRASTVWAEITNSRSGTRQEHKVKGLNIRNIVPCEHSTARVYTQKIILLVFLPIMEYVLHRCVQGVRGSKENEVAKLYIQNCSQL